MGAVRARCVLGTVSTTLTTNGRVLGICGSPSSSFRIREGTSGSPLALTSHGTRRAVVACLRRASCPMLDRRKGRLPCRGQTR